MPNALNFPHCNMDGIQCKQHLIFPIIMYAVFTVNSTKSSLYNKKAVFNAKGIKLLSLTVY